MTSEIPKCKKDKCNKGDKCNKSDKGDKGDKCDKGDKGDSGIITRPISFVSGVISNNVNYPNKIRVTAYIFNGVVTFSAALIGSPITTDSQGDFTLDTSLRLSFMFPPIAFPIIIASGILEIGVVNFLPIMRIKL